MTRFSDISRITLFLVGVVGTFLPADGQAFADGRLLRGEPWQPFEFNGNRADFYVAPDGSDAWSGTLAAVNERQTDGPFATIHRAQQAVRELKHAVYKEKQEPIEKRWIGSPHGFGEGRDILVLVRGGTYCLDEPLRFEPEDGGERCETNLPSGAFEYHKLKDYFVTYAAYPGEAPIVVGGRSVGPWERKDGLWIAPTNGMNVQKLVVDGRTQPLARTPNDGYFTASEMSPSSRALRFRPGDLHAWPEMQDNRIVMLLRWHTGVNAIASIDEVKRTAYLRTPQHGIRVVPPRYYVENIKSLLDAPGEWFFERKTNALSHLPDIGVEDLNTVRTLIPVLDRLITVEGLPGGPVRNLRIYGLELEAANAGGHAVSFQYAHRCELVGATVRAVGGTGIYIGKGCYRARVLENRVLEADQGGIAVAGNPHPERWLDIVRETVVSHNFVADCGGRSITATNCLDTVIAHNEVTRNRGRTAIQVGGWSNLEEAIDGGYRVEYNHLHDVQEQADDSGAITTAGLTHDSVVRGNLIHDLHGGFFNDNVAIWFDNMSSGWRVEDNIYYNLDQGQMKLCACNLVDNVYKNNCLIESPANPPEETIDGTPALEFGDVRTTDSQGEGRGSFETGELIVACAIVKNSGSTGLLGVDLYVDGKRTQTQRFPVIHNNSRQIRFRVQFAEPGQHKIAIGDSPYQLVTVAGERRSLLYHSQTLSDTVVPAGGTVRAIVWVRSVEDRVLVEEVPLAIDGEEVQTRSVQLAPGESRAVRFDCQPHRGRHQIQIGDAPPMAVEVYPHRRVSFTAADWKQHISGTAAPCRLDIDADGNRFRIEVAGTDFYHGEDSYGTVFLPAVPGNFVATVRIQRFGEKTHEWFRAGIFVRNDLTKSYDAGEGSLGSVLMFATPGRVGMHWDEHGDGCMHKAKSRNRAPTDGAPIWIRLVRHGNSFSGYASDDGEHWTESGHTEPIPGLAEAVDIGLAAGGPDQRVYDVNFEDFTLEVEQPEQMTKDE